MNRLACTAAACAALWTLSAPTTPARAGGFLLSDQGALATGRVAAVVASVSDGSRRGVCDPAEIAVAVPETLCRNPRRNWARIEGFYARRVELSICTV